MKIPVIPEKVIENEILEYLWLKKVFAWKNQSVGIFDPTKKVFRKSYNKFHIPGVSDILGVYQERFLAIEVKSKAGKVSQDQTDFINKINLSGGIAFVARSIEDVDNKLFNKKEGDQNENN